MSFEDELDDIENMFNLPRRIKDPSQLLVRRNQGRTKEEREIEEYFK